MENNNGLDTGGQDLFVQYCDEISEACERAVREALLKHKQAFNPIAVSRDGKVVILQPDEIEVR